MTDILMFDCKVIEVRHVPKYGNYISLNGYYCFNVLIKQSSTIGSHVTAFISLGMYAYALWLASVSGYAYP